MGTNSLLSSVTGTLYNLRNILIRTNFEAEIWPKIRTLSLRPIFLILILKKRVYSRRNNLEFVGIPNRVSQDNLEDNVIEILKSIDVNVQSDDIEVF